jgi:hypothetical protein
MWLFKPFFAVLELEHRTYTFNHSNKPSFMLVFFEIGSLKLLAWAGFGPWFSWFLPPEQLGLQAWATLTRPHGLLCVGKYSWCFFLVLWGRQSHWIKNLYLWPYLNLIPPLKTQITKQPHWRLKLNLSIWGDTIKSLTCGYSSNMEVKGIENGKWARWTSYI